jgi:hypothetical protein
MASAAEKLLEQMRSSKAGWRAPDLDRLYRGYGFDVIEGSKHRLYKHPDHPDLRATVTRAKSLAVGYVQTAVKLCDEVTRRASQGEKNA